MFPTAQSSVRNTITEHQGAQHELDFLMRLARGAITKRLQEEFFALTSGAMPDRHGWLTPVGLPVSADAR